MATVEATIEGALYQRLGALVLSPTRRIAWPGENFTPASAETFLEPFFLPNRNQRIFIGSNEPHRRIGILQVNVRAPEGTKAIDVTEIAGQVAAHFPTDLKLHRGGLMIRIMSAPDIAPALVQPPHRTVPISISYECFA